MRSRLGALFGLCAAGLSIAGCRSAESRDGEVAEDASVAETPSLAAAAAGSFAETGSWAGETSTGTPVRVTTESVPVRPGPLSLRIEVESLAAQVLPVSVDLVSPEMPMHGITRYDATAVSPREYLVELEVPMEGRWLLYINLDVGVNAASFEVDIPASDAGHQHHGSPLEEPEEEPEEGAATDHEHP